VTPWPEPADDAAATPIPAPPGPESAADGIDLSAMIRLLRTAGSAMLVQISLYAALAQVEWAQERNRLQDMVIAGVLGTVSLIGLLLFSGVLALALAWDTAYRIPVAVMLVALHGLGCAFAWYRMKSLSRRSAQSFAVTRCELSADLAAIKAAL
jgi:uncharacterized membrane protein YqjE